EDGGHIGYAIAPAYRNRGYGKILLKLLIDETNKMGISRILITVQNDNIASVQVALNNGGIIEKSNDVRTYIWIDSGV
ncbi:MAG: GNAT family N-acetyltransferase, partial [Defluviitaleaceae bacterium]|nr:GNAT family N-acetyltransferase [Defluviitaleaceae bacterium]